MSEADHKELANSAHVAVEGPCSVWFPFLDPRRPEATDCDGTTFFRQTNSARPLLENGQHALGPT